MNDQQHDDHEPPADHEPHPVDKLVRAPAPTGRAHLHTHQPPPAPSNHDAYKAAQRRYLQRRAKAQGNADADDLFPPAA